VHIVDVLGRPVSEIPPGQHLAILDEIRMTVRRDSRRRFG